MARFTFSICVTVFLSLSLTVRRGYSQSGGGNHWITWHVSSERKGCDAVQSQWPCPATMLNPDIAIDYEYDVDWIDVTLNDTKMNNASDECISALTTTLCSTLTPRCFMNGSKDFGDARVECWKANRTCPVDSLDEGTCETLKIGVHPLSSCVKSSNHINGSCPQPKYKMPVDKLELYKRASKEYEEVSYFESLTTASYANGTRMFSSECVSKITELYCLPFYCSTDEQQIVVEYTYEDCEDTFNECFDPVASELSHEDLEDLEDLKDKYVQNCDFYPDATEPTTPPGFTGSRSPTTTHSVQKVSSTPPVRNMSSTPSGRKVSSAPPARNMSSTPAGQNVSTTLPRKNVSTPHPGKNVSTPHPGKNVSTTPPMQNMSSKPPGEPTSPRTKQTPLSEKTPSSKLLKTPSPTAGNDRCQNFPLLMMLLVFLVLGKLN